MDDNRDTGAISGEYHGNVSAGDILSDWNSGPESARVSAGPTADSDESSMKRSEPAKAGANENWPRKAADISDRTDGVNDTGTGIQREADQSFSLKHLGEVRSVSRDEMITLAQKGLDYDRQRQRNDELLSRNRALLAEAERFRSSGDGKPAAAERPMKWEEAAVKRRNSEVREFIAEYGGVDPKNIPQEVWQAVTDGKPLLSAYQFWELKKLKAESAASVKAAENREKSAGSRTSAGNERHRDAITADWYS